MIENLQEKLHPGKRKQSKGAKICASIRCELQCKKCSKTFCKIFGRQTIQNQANAKHQRYPKYIFRSAKYFKKSLTLERTSLKLPYLKF